MKTAFTRIFRLTPSVRDHGTRGAGRVQEAVGTSAPLPPLLRLLDSGREKRTKKTKTATVSNRYGRTRTDTMVVNIALYIYLLVHFCLTVYKK